MARHGRVVGVLAAIALGALVVPTAAEAKHVPPKTYIAQTPTGRPGFLGCVYDNERVRSYCLVVAGIHVGPNAGTLRVIYHYPDPTQPDPEDRHAQRWVNVPGDSLQIAVVGDTGARVTTATFNATLPDVGAVSLTLVADERVTGPYQNYLTSLGHPNCEIPFAAHGYLPVLNAPGPATLSWVSVTGTVDGYAIDGTRAGAIPVPPVANLDRCQALWTARATTYYTLVY